MSKLNNEPVSNSNQINTKMEKQKMVNENVSDNNSTQHTQHIDHTYTPNTQYFIYDETL